MPNLSLFNIKSSIDNVPNCRLGLEEMIIDGFNIGISSTATNNDLIAYASAMEKITGKLLHYRTLVQFLLPVFQKQKSSVPDRPSVDREW